MQVPKSALLRYSLNRFHAVIGQGWFIEAREGRLGPFLRRSEAEQFLRKHIQRRGWHRHNRTSQT